jgi:non-specific serine/threonine protein kinase
LGVREARDCDLIHALFSFLATRDMLLIFDNFEHLLPAVLFLSELLATCPTLHVLVTSRARLHLYGEHDVVVSPLPLPAHNDPLGAADAAAVRLFCDRAQAARAGFQLTPSLTPVVAEICRQLDGLPLAIELAAARLRLLSPQELRQRLEHRLPLLRQDSPGLPFRRQGLEDAIAWSYGLLSPAERTLLARLAVFVGGFSLAAAAGVCAFPSVEPITATADSTVGIQALLDQSLLAREGVEATANFAIAGCCGRCSLRTLQATAAAASRFTMLEIIREFALAQLRASGELEIVQHRHALHFADWAAQAEEALNGPDQAAWLAKLEEEADNLRVALAWLLANGPPPVAAGMACALGAFWQRHGHYSEGRRWLEQVLAQIAHTPVPDTLRARVLRTAASLAYRQGDWRTAQAWLNESLTLYREAADRLGVARVLFDLGWIAVDNTAWADAAHLNEESLTLAREVGDLCAMYQALTNLGWVRLCVGQWEVAATLFEEARAVAGRAGHVKGIAVSLVNLGWIALHAGDTGRAAALSRDSVRLCHLLGEREVLAECLEILADAAACEHDFCRAAELHGAADGLWDALHVTRPPIQLTAGLHGWVTTAQPLQSSGPAVEAAWQRGRALSLDAMVAYALACGGAPARLS